MMRASAVAEQAGVPSVSLVCSGFVGQASTTADGLGFTELPVAMMPGHVNMQTYEELEKNILDVTVDQVIEGLTVEVETAAVESNEPRARDIVCSGSFEEVDEFFYDRQWSDGL
ncbi:MAG: hypothetical protein JRJ58_24020, partial [Deltaproteobacteria bacterium]|nr:hypothetical protein [Deltaproteobacteria bacterium]